MGQEGQNWLAGFSTLCFLDESATLAATLAAKTAVAGVTKAKMNGDEAPVVEAAALDGQGGEGSGGGGMAAAQMATETV